MIRLFVFEFRPNYVLIIIKKMIDYLSSRNWIWQCWPRKGSPKHMLYILATLKRKIADQWTGSKYTFRPYDLYPSILSANSKNKHIVIYLFLFFLVSPNKPDILQNALPSPLMLATSTSFLLLALYFLGFHQAVVRAGQVVQDFARQPYIEYGHKENTILF